MQTTIRAQLLRVTAVVVVMALVLMLPGHAQRARAQELDADLEEQALVIETQLLCPQCTNKRLDVCDLEICDDMRAIIRRQLAAGTAPDDIVDYFRGRYGDRILAELPREGFNLVLFGWVGGSALLVAAAGALFLMQLRRSSSAREAAARDPATGPAADLTDDRASDAWIDAQLAAEIDGERGKGDR